MLRARFTVHHDAFVVHRPHPYGNPASQEVGDMWHQNIRWCGPPRAAHSYVELQGAEDILSML